MIRFFAAQSADPFDPAPLLILADHQEEWGDVTGAMVFRGLASCGLPSLHVLAMGATLVPLVLNPDVFMQVTWDGSGSGDGDWHGDGDGDGGKDGHGDGDEEWTMHSEIRNGSEEGVAGGGCGDGHSYLCDRSSGCVLAIGMGFACESGHGHEEGGRDRSVDAIRERLEDESEHEERVPDWDDDAAWENFGG